MPREDKAALAEAVAPLTAEAVGDYLLSHPDFFEARPDVLAGLAAARPGRSRADGVVDLQSFMVERLRNEVERLKQGQQAIVGMSRANQNTQQRVHAAVLFLLDARSFEELIHTVTTDLAVLLDVDVVSLLIEAGPEEGSGGAPAGLRLVDAGFVAHATQGEEILLLGDIAGDEAVFGSGAGLVRSQALARLTIAPDCPPCLLALGSRQSDAFTPGMRTELITFLGRVLERVIRSWLQVES